MSDPLSTPERFDSWSRVYDSRRSRLFFGGVHQRLVPLLGIAPGWRVLDVGCGTGSLLLRLADAFPAADFTGADVSPGMIDVARGKAGPRENLRFEVAPVEALPFGGGSFDLVVSTLSFHHWSDRAAGLAECRRVLKAGGGLALVDISGEHRAARIFRIFGPLGNLFSPHTGYPRAAELADMVNEAHFDHVRQMSLWPAILLTRARRPADLEGTG